MSDPLLDAFVARAGIVALCSLLRPSLRPAAVGVALAALFSSIALAPAWLRASVCVAWPGVEVACAAWALRVRGARTIASAYGVATVATAVIYLHLHALWPTALLASRLSAALLVIALFALRRPRFPAELAAALPAALLVVDVVVGVWPLAFGGLFEVIGAWEVARAASWLSILATAGAALWCVSRETS